MIVYNIVLFWIALFLLSGCDNSTVTSKVLREYSFTKNEISHANEKHIMILSLEHYNAGESSNDLGTAGSDCYEFQPTTDLDSVSMDIVVNSVVGSVNITDVVAEEVSILNNMDMYNFKANRRYEICVVHNGLKDVNQTLFLYFSSKTAVLRADQESVNRLIVDKSCTGHECDLSDGDLSNMDLLDANLSGARMHGANLYKSNLTRADLTGTNLSNIYIAHAIFDNTTISESTSFSFRSSMEYASFVKTIFNGITFQADRTRTLYKNVDFSHASFLHVNMYGISFNNCKFNDAIFNKTNMTNSKFSKNEFQGADFSKLLTSNEIDEDTSFYEADLRGISSASFDLLRESGANLDKSIIANAGDGPHVTYYENLGKIELYHDAGCKGQKDTLISTKEYHINCKEESKCTNDAIASVLFYPKVKKGIALRLYDDSEGRIHVLAGDEDYITIYRNSQEIEEPFCISGFEHDTTEKGFIAKYHHASFPNTNNLTGHVSYIKLVDESDL